MRVMLYGEKAECQSAIDIIQSFCRVSEASDTIHRTDSREGLQQQMVAWNPNLIVILAERSRGMEGAYAAKETRPEIPVFWFSDDEGFGMQSHRLECDYFSVKPVTEEKLKKAFLRCRHMGVQIEDF